MRTRTILALLLPLWTTGCATTRAGRIGQGLGGVALFAAGGATVVGGALLGHSLASDPATSHNEHEFSSIGAGAIIILGGAMAVGGVVLLLQSLAAPQQ